MTARDAHKKFIRQLPVWQYVAKFDASLEELKYGIDNDVASEINSLSESVERLPTFPVDGQPIVHPSQSLSFNETVKICKRDPHSKELSVVNNDKQADLKNQGPSSVTTTSIDLLRSKPFSSEPIFARLREGEPWKECILNSVYHKSKNGRPFIKFIITSQDGVRYSNIGKYEIARKQSHGESLRVPKRVIAGPDENEMTSGIIGQEPCKENKNRYMILMDDGSAHYFKPERVYPILYQSAFPWRDLRNLNIINRFLDAELNHFFKQYPRRNLLLTHVGQRIEVSRNGVVVPAMVLKIDCDVIKIVYKDQSEECLFRGSPRFMKRADIASRLLSDEIHVDRLYPKLVGNVKRYHDAGCAALGEDFLKFIENFDTRLTICGRNIARKSTARVAPPRMKISVDNEEVPEDTESIPELQDLQKRSTNQHKCSVACKHHSDMRTEGDVKDIMKEFRSVSDLKVPLMLGWQRILVKSTTSRGKSRTIQYAYIAPCGKVFNRIFDIRRYIQTTNSFFDIDYFTLDREVRLNRSIGQLEAYYFEEDIAIDKSKQPLENKMISLINPYSEERLPLDFEYRNETFPHPMLAKKGFSFNHEFKSGCDCVDDCWVRASCACHILNEDAAGSGAHNRGSIDHKCQYKEKRLLDQVSTGIFECNSYCQCSSKCPNRVMQNGIRIRLQVRKTIDKGWGVFVLDDVPKGTFICTYSAELLDDADQYGDSDMYYADLDYISVVEEQKRLLMNDEEKSDEGVGSEDSDFEFERKTKSKSKKRHIIEESDEDNDIPPVDNLNGQIDYFLPQNTRYPRREKVNTDKANSDREKQHERSSTFKKLHTLLDETQDYTLDARMQGNIGRFFNHSCDPNAFVQNVFIETHDLRFPVVAFFTKRHVKAEDEITWNYQYKIDSIAGRQIICNCGAANCQGRIL